MPTPCSGQIGMSNINAEFGKGNNLNAYHGVAGAPAAGTIAYSHLRCKSNTITIVTRAYLVYYYLDHGGTYDFCLTSPYLEITGSTGFRGIETIVKSPDNAYNLGYSSGYAGTTSFFGTTNEAAGGYLYNASQLGQCVSVTASVTDTIARFGSSYIVTHPSAGNGWVGRVHTPIDHDGGGAFYQAQINVTLVAPPSIGGSSTWHARPAGWTYVPPVYEPGG